ncbi:MAG: AsmA-like C-terminal region-containing protein [Xanthomonadales bacterium]
MRRILLSAFLILLAALVLAVGAGAWLLHDESFLKQRLAALAQEQTGRSLHLDGPLDIDLGRVTTIEARGVRFGNAAWARSEDLFVAERLRIGLDLPSLFGDLPVLTEVILEDCAVALERDAAGRGSWQLDTGPASDDPSETDTSGPFPFMVKRTDITRCRLRLYAPDGEETLDLRLDSAQFGQAAAANRIDAVVRGELNDQPLTLDGWLAPIGVFTRGGALRHELRIRAGPVQLDSVGTIADLHRLTGLELHTRFSGPEIGTLLDSFQQPPISAGAFDFRIDLDTQDALTTIGVNGDLGSLEIAATGSVDGLRRPETGHIELTVEGPDLAALGEALGIPGLVREPYTAGLTASIANGVLNIDRAELSTTADLVDIAGMIPLNGALPGTDVTASLESGELGRWAELLHRGPGRAGAVTVNSRFDVDPDGRLSIDARLRQGEARLRLQGPIGSLDDGLDARIEVDFEAPRPGPVLHWLAGRELPAIPLAASGTLGFANHELRFDDVRVATGPHELLLAGRLGLGPAFADSRLEGVFDSPDLAALGRALGRDDLPAGPLRIDGSLRPDGAGLAFTVREGSLGDVRLRLDGRLPDRARPRDVDADFELFLPGPGPLLTLLPELDLPDRPVTARGGIGTRGDELTLRDTELTLGDISLRVDGSVARERHFAVRLAARGDDASALSGLAGTTLPGQAFQLDAQLTGDAEQLAVDDLALTLGDSRVQGELRWNRDKLLSGRLHAPRLNLTPWVAPPDQAAPPSRSERRFMFDDTPVLQIADRGVRIDGEIVIDELQLNNARATQIRIGVALDGRRLEIAPFSARGMAGGVFNGSLSLDGQNGLPRLDVDLHATDQALSIGAYAGQDPATLPRGTLELVLHGQGRTHRELAASLDGRLRMNYGAGELAPASFSFLLTDFLSELIAALNPFSQREAVTRLDCLVIGADATDGQVEVGPAVIHAERLTIVTKGDIDLHTERIVLDFETRPRTGIGISASDVINPFVRVGGTLTKPAITLNPAGTVVEGGLAVATAGLSILAKSLAKRYLSSRDPCGDALRDLEERDRETP